MRNLFRFRRPEAFFIRGYAKSGTTWLSNLMNLHPQISSISEFHLAPLFEGAKSISDLSWSVLRHEPNSRLMHDALHRTVKQLIIDICGARPRCGDKTPYPLRTTFIPGVKNLYITRDGRDVVVSWFYHTMNLKIDTRPEMLEKMRQFDENPYHFEENKQQLLSCEVLVRDVAQEWNATILDDFQMMHSADQGEIDLPYLWLRYEDLQLDTQKQRDKAYRFLGLSPSKAECLDSRTKAGFGDPNTNQPDKFFRRGRAGTWREYFTDEQLGWFMDEAEEAMGLIGTL
ncbi:sulfotransferase domain-containing protein [Aporhodopirellula aestuarii]|uniref:Sulfotransferase domain-containing protein n=1 Tax=Aporhodopirellula aestuarii TaxID=2950107 RepID=A0ABT0U056_9BACT|nr:sulfotransferase domain-containing protein [Aporhodopirellula aestuarii]MCM2370258.1 sulfotransferase domain-containing protein [Aporhodopirellula aestuarii]